MGKRRHKPGWPAEAAQSLIAMGEPTITHYIDPPFQIRVEGDVMHVDAPCVVGGDGVTVEVLRFSLSAGAAMVLKDALNMITFVEASGLLSHNN